MPYEFSIEEDAILVQLNTHEDIRAWPASLAEKFKFGQTEIRGIGTLFTNLAEAMATSAELTAAIETIEGINLDDYATIVYVDDAIEGIDLSPYATTVYVDDAIEGIDLSPYATTVYVDDAIDAINRWPVGNSTGVLTNDGSGNLSWSSGGNGVELGDENIWTAIQRFEIGLAGVDATGNDTQAQDLEIVLGRSTGNAVSGKMVIRAASKGVASGSTLGVLRDVLLLEQHAAVGNPAFFTLFPVDGMCSLGKSDAAFYAGYFYQMLVQVFSSRPGSFWYWNGNDGAGTFGDNFKIAWSPNGAASGTYDVGIRRESPGLLRIVTGIYDDALRDVRLRAVKCDELHVSNSVAATTLGIVVGKIEVFDALGVSLGFVPVFDDIS